MKIVKLLAVLTVLQFLFGCVSVEYRIRRDDTDYAIRYNADTGRIIAIADNHR